MLSSNDKPLPPCPHWTHTPISLLSEAHQAITRHEAVVTSITNTIKPEEATFTNTLRPLSHAENIFTKTAQTLGFYRFVSGDAELRRVSTQVQGLFDDLHAKVLSNETLFKLIEAVNHRNEEIDDESRRLVETKHRAFIRQGFNLTAEARERYNQINAQLSKLKLEYRRNLTEDNEGLWFTRDELAGVSADLIASLRHGEVENEGKLFLTFITPHVYPVLRYAISAKMRERVYVGNDNRCVANVDLFRRIVVLRDQAARLLEFEDHAAFRLEDRMIRDSRYVMGFLRDLRTRMEGIGRRELDGLKELKRRDVEGRGEVYDGKLHHWDHGFYNRMMLDERMVDHTLLSEGFSLENTIGEMMGIYQHLFGIIFEDVRDGEAVGTACKHTDLSWHEDVKLYLVSNSPDHGGDVLGYIYMDLFPRQGKHGHCSNFNLWPGFENPDGSRQLPVTALITNFTRPTPCKPSLLRHEEVTTLFHEFGHGIHDLVSRTKYSQFHGTNVSVDFGEAPSQLLENWCWDAGVLKRIGRHYSYISEEYHNAWRGSTAKGEEQPEERIPDDLVQQLVDSRRVNGGLAVLRQLSLAMFDMDVHTPDTHEAIVEMNISATFNRLRREIIGTLGPDGAGDDWGHAQATFAHLVGDYDAGYYSYLLSQVYSTDIFDTKFKSDLMNAEEGWRYRKTLLEKGGSQDEMKTLMEYLGRPPSSHAFYKELGRATSLLEDI